MAPLYRLRTNEIQNGNIINANDLNAELDQLVAQANALDDALNVVTSQNSTFAGTKSFTQAPRLDALAEATTDAGITVDGLLIKDGTLIPAVATAPSVPASGQLWYQNNLQELRWQGATTPQTVQPLHVGYIAGRAPEYTSTTEVTLPFGMTVADETGTRLMRITNPAGLLLSLNVNGVGGLDAGIKQANTWYYIWVCAGSSGTTAIFSSSRTNPVLPAGYGEYRRMLPLATRNGPANTLLSFQILNWPHQPFFFYDAVESSLVGASASGPYVALSAGSSTTFSALNVGGWVPPIARSVHLHFALRGNSVYLRKTGSSGTGWRFSGVSGSDISQVVAFPLDTNRTFEYRVDSSSTHIAVVGYTITEV